MEMRETEGLRERGKKNLNNLAQKQKKKIFTGYSLKTGFPLQRMMHFLGRFMMTAFVVLSSTKAGECSPMDKNLGDLKSLYDQSRGNYYCLAVDNIKSNVL